MVEYEELYDYVKARLSEKRFKHTLGVVERAIEYAKIYNVNIEDAKKSAILHDCAKEIPKEEALKLLDSYGYKLDDIEKINFNLLHAKLGAEIAEIEFGMSNDIANAIRYHTTGRENMSMLEKVIFLADATEKNREYKDNENELSLEETVNLIKKDINEGLIYVLKWSIKSILRRNLYIHLDSIRAYNYFLNN